MPVTPLNPPKNDRYTSPGFVSPPGLLNANAPGTTPAAPSAGLITTPATPAPYTTNPSTAKESTSVGYNPVGFSVNKNQTVAGQVDNITAQDSPLMQQARTRANQAMVARGLLSSSAAVGAGESAVIGAALPIAQQDASTYNAAHTNTQNATNAALNFGAQATNTASGQNAQLGTSVSMANAEAANKALQDSFQAKSNYGLATLDANVKVALSNLDTQTKVTLTQMENQNRQLLQTSQGAAAMFNQVATSIANIRGNPNITNKESAIADQLNSLNEAFRLQGDIAGLDLSGYFVKGAVGQEGDPANFDHRPLMGNVPTGGGRDAQGNVFNADGTPVTAYRGPVGQPAGTLKTTNVTTPENWQPGMPVPPGYQVIDPPSFGGGDSKLFAKPVLVPIAGGGGGGTAPTGTVTNPANWRPGMPIPAGYRLDNRGGRIVPVG